MEAPFSMKPEIISSYPFIPKSYHIDHHLNLKSFETLRLALIIKDEKRLFPKQKTICLPITKNIPEKITKNEPVDINELNINTALKIA